MQNCQSATFAIAGIFGNSVNCKSAEFKKGCFSLQILEMFFLIFMNNLLSD